MTVERIILAIMNRVRLLLIPLSLLLALAACFGGGNGATNDPPPGPQAIAGATEIVKFNPAALPINGQAVAGTCDASALLPGAYRCQWDGGADEPCFAPSGARLVCGPDPAAGTYRALVALDAPPPPLAALSPDQQVEFFVELADGQTCARRVSPEPVMLDGTPAAFDCAAPFTYLPALDKSAPTWQATPLALDPATGQVAASAPVAVVRAWIP